MVISSLEKTVIKEKLNVLLDEDDDCGFAIFVAVTCCIYRVEQGNTREYLYLVVDGEDIWDVDISRDSGNVSFDTRNHKVFVSGEIDDIVDRLIEKDGDESVRLWFLETDWAW